MTLRRISGHRRLHLLLAPAAIERRENVLGVCLQNSAGRRLAQIGERRPTAAGVALAQAALAAKLSHLIVTGYGGFQIFAEDAASVLANVRHLAGLFEEALLMCSDFFQLCFIAGDFDQFGLKRVELRIALLSANKRLFKSYASGVELSEYVSPLYGLAKVDHRPARSGPEALFALSDALQIAQDGRIDIGGPQWDAKDGNHGDCGKKRHEAEHFV